MITNANVTRLQHKPSGEPDRYVFLGNNYGFPQLTIYDHRKGRSGQCRLKMDVADLEWLQEACRVMILATKREGSECPA